MPGKPEAFRKAERRSRVKCWGLTLILTVLLTDPRRVERFGPFPLVPIPAYTFVVMARFSEEESLVAETGQTPEGIGQSDHFLFVGRKR